MKIVIRSEIEICDIKSDEIETVLDKILSLFRGVVVKPEIKEVKEFKEIEEKQLEKIKLDTNARVVIYYGRRYNIDKLKKIFEKLEEGNTEYLIRELGLSKRTIQFYKNMMNKLKRLGLYEELMGL